MKTPPLPASFNLKDGFLTDPEGYDRYVLQANGNINRALVASLLSAWGFHSFASEWRGESTLLLKVALTDCISALEGYAPHMRPNHVERVIENAKKALQES